jgi:hypothetical protein
MHATSHTGRVLAAVLPLLGETQFTQPQGAPGS